MANSIGIVVKLFGSLREEVGAKQLEFDLDAGTTVQQLRAQLVEKTQATTWEGG